MRCLALTKQLYRCHKTARGAWPYCELPRHRRQPLYVFLVLLSGVVASYTAAFLPTPLFREAHAPPSKSLSPSPMSSRSSGKARPKPALQPRTGTQIQAMWALLENVRDRTRLAVSTPPNRASTTLLILPNVAPNGAVAGITIHGLVNQWGALGLTDQLERPESHLEATLGYVQTMNGKAFTLSVNPYNTDQIGPLVPQLDLYLNLDNERLVVNNAKQVNASSTPIRQSDLESAFDGLRSFPDSRGRDRHFFELAAHILTGLACHNWSQLEAYCSGPVAIIVGPSAVPGSFRASLDSNVGQADLLIRNRYLADGQIDSALVEPLSVGGQIRPTGTIAFVFKQAQRRGVLWTPEVTYRVEAGARASLSTATIDYGLLLRNAHKSWRRAPNFPP
jgi:hypothetical protein